jgi:hypothetical protein
MVLFDELRHYLNSSEPSYSEGVELLFRLTHKNGLRASLLEFHDTTKLYKNLNEVYDTIVGNPSPSDSPAVNHQTATVIPAQAGIFHPPIVSELEEKRIQLFKELSHYHTLMADLPFDAEFDPKRYEYMQKCVLIDAELDELRNDITYAKKTGHAPIRKTIPRQLDEGQAQMALRMQKLQNNTLYDRTLIKKLLKELDECTILSDMPALQQKLAKAKDRLAKKESEIKLLRSQIKGG